jgi:mitochondrial fission process protein 1
MDSDSGIEFEDVFKSDERMEDAHGLAYVGWIGRTVARLPKMIAHQRWLAYASEGTEPFRPIAHPWLVRSGYALSLVYVVTDIGVRTNTQYRSSNSVEKAAIVFGDSFVFHSLASMILPALLIHAIVKHSSVGIVRYNVFAGRQKVREYAPTVLGLASIPFVVGPIDHGVEYVLDNTIRTLYDKELVAHDHGN